MAEIVIGRSASDMKHYGHEGTIFIGKQYIKMGETMSLANKVLMDVVRPHVILICGKRGEGKCLHGDTQIILSDGSIRTIKELSDDSNDILALDHKLKLRRKEKTKFYIRTVNNLLKVKLRTGKEIKLTPEHPLLTVKGWENASNLSEGSRIATPRRVEVFGSESLEESKIKILAYLISEGHLGNNFVLFSNNDNKILKDFKNAIKDFDKNLQIKDHGQGSLRIVENRKRELSGSKRDDQGKFIKGTKFESKSSIRKWLDQLKLYGKSSLTKFIPEIIVKLPKNKISLFLNRIFSCGGTIYPRENTWDIAYSSSSENLIKQVQHLLLRFGIISIIKVKITDRNINYELIIRGENVLRYMQEIGFFGEKELRQSKALRELSSKKQNPNLDTIPKEVWDLYRPKSWTVVGKEMGYYIPKGLRSSINYAPSRQKLLQIAKIDENEMVRQLAESDIYWDEIVGIEELNGNFEVYDISVPDYHNFVAGDIIVHNSYTMAMIAEGISNLPPDLAQNVAPLFLDTLGIFWTMKKANYRDEELLSKWGLEPTGLTNVKLFVPGGKFDELKNQGIPVDEKFYLTTSELGPDEWAYAMGIEPTTGEGVLISRVIIRLRKTGKKYGIDDIMKEIDLDDESDRITRSSTKGRFEAIKDWGLFAKEGTAIETLIKGGQASILDISIYAHVYGAFSIRALVVGLYSKKILEQRMAARKIEEKEEIEKGFAFFRKREVKKKKIPIVWIFIDEVHEFLPLEGSTLASGPLLQLIREGRQPGISMVVATQQPGKMNTDVLSQCDLVLSHRVTAKDDINALNKIMQSYMASTLGQLLNEMPRIKGVALVLDQNQERVYSIQMRPRFSWHGGETPTAVPPKQKKF